MTDLFSESEVESGSTSGGRGTSARAARKRAHKRRRQRRRNLLTFTVMIVALALLVGGAWVLVRPLLSGGGATTAAITDYPGPGNGEADVVVAPGDSGSDIGVALVEADVVASVDAFTAAYTANPDATAIQAGQYTLPLQMRASDAVAALLDPGNRSDLRVTIPEGWRAAQIYARVAEVLEVPTEEVEQAAGDVELPDAAGGEIEGWLFATTYSLAPDATPTSVLQQMVDQTESVLARLDVPADAQEDTINAASIVEAEVFDPDDRGQVARVIENRIEGCSRDGYLGMDSTLQYGLGMSQSEITAEGLWNDPHPYNGRQNAGLPPTPINSPSEASIAAVVSPPAGDWCYFVTVNLETGETKFTADYSEFQVFRQEYRDWVAEQSAAPED